MVEVIDCAVLWKRLIEERRNKERRGSKTGGDVASLYNCYWRGMSSRLCLLLVV